MKQRVLFRVCVCLDALSLASVSMSSMATVVMASRSALCSPNWPLVCSNGGKSGGPCIHTPHTHTCILMSDCLSPSPLSDSHPPRFFPSVSITFNCPTSSLRFFIYHARLQLSLYFVFISYCLSSLASSCLLPSSQLSVLFSCQSHLNCLSCSSFLLVSHPHFQLSLAFI